MKNFGISLKGRVKNFSLPKHQPLIPLFEAVVNSFHAIEELQKQDSDFKRGKIEIILEREGQMHLEGLPSLLPIENITIIDNGIGFNESNFRSFLESDSTYKQSLGGKGVGRFSWLVVFEKALVESIYKKSGTFVQRSFVFSEELNEINDELLECSAERNQTKVTLINLKSSFKNFFPKQALTIATKLLYHCLIYFMSDNCPEVYLYDNNETINLNHLFNEKIKTDENKEIFNIDGENFELLHVKAEDPNMKGNQLFLCAHNRLVQTKDLESLITDLNRAIYNENGFLYLGVLSSSYFDKNVDMNRLSFNIPEGALQKTYPAFYQ